MSKAYEYTDVPTHKSRAEIEAMLRAHGVEAVRFTSLPSGAIVEFVRAQDGRQYPYRIDVMPKVRPDVRGQVSATERDRAERQIWRVLYYHLKALFVAIDFGLKTFENAFLADLVLADGQGTSATVAQIMGQHLAGRVSIAADPFGGMVPALPEVQS